MKNKQKHVFCHSSLWSSWFLSSNFLLQFWQIL